MGLRHYRINIISKLLFAPFNILLVLILALGFGLRFFNLSYNSMFLDEALYIMRGVRILDGHLAEVLGDISWIGGFPFFYPLLSGILYTIGGLMATRMLSVLLGMISLVFMYIFTKHLAFFKDVRTNTLAALVATTFMATSAIPILISRTAVYDVLSFTLFLGGLTLLQKALQTRNPTVFFSAAIVIFFSFLAKYIVAIYFPFLVVFPFSGIATKSRKRAIEIFRYFCAPLILMTFVYAGFSFKSLENFFFQHAVSTKSTIWEVFRNFWVPSWFSLVLSFLGMALLRRTRLRFVSLLFVAALLPLIVHLMGSNSQSIAKHSFLSLLFLFPVIGAAGSAILSKHKRTGLFVITNALVLNLFFGLPYVRQGESFWPNSNNAVAFLREKVAPTDKILVEGSDIMALALYNTMPLENISGPFAFSYGDLEGLPAYLQAINDGYFRFVQLEGTYFPEEYTDKLEEVLKERYTNVYDDSGITIYQFGR